MTRSFAILSVAALTLAITGATAENASAQRQVKAGTLNCDISAGVGLIVGSEKQVSCLFTPVGRGRRVAYVGSISKIGLDLGATSGGRMAWSVYAPSRRFSTVAGDYTGAAAQATVGAGGGVNVLVGGSNRTVALQPISVDSETGLNVSAGIAELHLRPAR